MKRCYYVPLLLGCMILMLVSCKMNKSARDETEIVKPDSVPTSSNLSRKVTFQPYWVATAQFAGYYMAKEMGLYKKYGIDLEIIPFQPFYSTSDLIKTGKVDFMASWLVNAIQMRASGVDIVNIAQFSTRSSLMLLTKKSSGISELSDMNGKRAGIWTGFELHPNALFKKYHLDVKIIPIGSSNNLFLKDAVDIGIASWFDEYHSIINSGYEPEELNIFFFADYGLNFLEDGIYCLAEKRKKEPQLCADFVNATAEGWTLAFENPDKAIDIVVAYAHKSNLPVNRIHQKWILDRYRDLYKHDGKYSTVLKEADYLFAANVLKEGGLITQTTSFQDFYKHY